jgi:DNA polymerase-4
VSRTIAHLDADAFYVSVELLRRPELRGLPVVVAGTSPRAVVTTASYEARRFGVQSAVPAARARRLCPDAVFIEPDFDSYRAFSKRMMGLVRAAVERVEVVGPDEAYLDLSGMVAPNAAMRRLVGEIRSELGLHCSVGIGPNKLIAKLASDAEKPRGFVPLTAEEARARFGGEPAERLPGVGPKTAHRLGELGITTIAELGAAPVEQLERAFGPRLGPYLARRGRLEDDSPVETDRAAVSESRERTFPRDVADPAEMERILDELAARLCDDLLRKGRRGRTIAIKVRLDDFTTVTRARTLSEATDERAVVQSVARQLLRAYAPPRPVRLLGVRVAGFEEQDADGAPAGQLELPV